MSQQNEDVIQFAKERIKSALSSLAYTKLDHAGLDDTMRSWMESWLQPALQDDAQASDAYKQFVFDERFFLHYSPKNGDVNPRYGWQTVLRGPLFESRKNFRSLRAARLWAKQQMLCKYWPKSTSSEHREAEGIINMAITFDYDGVLDLTRFKKNDEIG